MVEHMYEASCPLCAEEYRLCVTELLELVVQRQPGAPPGRAVMRPQSKPASWRVSWSCSDCGMHVLNGDGWSLSCECAGSRAGRRDGARRTRLDHAAADLAGEAT